MEEQKLNEAWIQQLLKKAMLAKDADAISVLKMIKTKISTEKGRLKNVDELSDTEIMKIIKREIKEIRDTVESLRKAGMTDRIASEENKLKVLEQLLPPALSEQEIQVIIEEVIKETGKENFGRIMKAVMQRVAGRADGKLVNEMVRKAMAG